MNPLRSDLATDAGMLCVWDAQTFSQIDDYESWDKQLCEDKDIRRHINAGHFVPLYLGDGAFAVELRIGVPESISAREREYLLVPSQPYRLNTTGRVMISAIEQVGGDPRSFIELELDPGGYAVQALLIDWTQEPGSTDADGNAVPDALPDMIVYIENDLLAAAEYRTEVETFRKEDALR